jgi:hypothetical protein
MDVGADGRRGAGPARRWSDRLHPGLAPLFILALALLLLWPALMAPGLVGLSPHRGGTFLMIRVHQMSSALLSLHFPPRWMPDAAHGLGDPLWIYHGPLAYVLPAGIAVLSGGFIGGIKVTWALLLPTAALGAYTLGRRVWGSAAAGLLSAGAYLAAPAMVAGVYARPDALPELAGMALSPWLLVAADRLIERPSAGRMGWLALGFALLLTSDPVAGLLFLLLLPLWRLLGHASRHDLHGADVDPDFEPEPEPRLPAVPPGFGRSGSGRSGSGRSGSGQQGADQPGYGRPGFGPEVLVQGRPRGLAGIQQACEHLGERLELALWRRRPEGGIGKALPTLLALLLGLLLALWFVAPAVLERDQVRPGSEASASSETPLYEGLAFVDRELPSTLAWAGDAELPQRSGLLQLVLAALGLGLALAGTDRRRRRRAFAWAVLALLPLLLSHAIARPLWAALPLWPGGWQPWRMLQLHTLALAILSGSLVLPLSRGRDATATALEGPLYVRAERPDRAKQSATRPDGRQSVAIGWLVAIGLSLGLTYLATMGLPVGVLGIEGMSRADLSAFETFSGTSGAWGDAGHLPVSASTAPISGIDTVLGHEGAPRVVPGFGLLDRATWTHREAARQDWQIAIASGQATTLVFPTHWFPGWSYSIDGQPARAASPLEGSGWVEVALAPDDCSGGDCTISLILGRSGLRALAEGISLLALLVLGLLLLREPRLRLGRSFVASLVVLTLLVVAARALPQGAETGLRVVDASADLPHVRPEGLRFGEARLERASLRLPSSDGIGAESDSGPVVALDAGDRLEAELFFTDAPSDLRVALALVTPAERSRGVPDVWATSEAAITAEEPMALDVPDAVSSGLYLLRLDLSGPDGSPIEAQDEAGLAIGPVYLGPIRVRGRPDLLEREEGVVAVMGDITLQAVQTEVRGTPEGIWLMVDLTWRCDRAPVLDYVSSVRLLDAKGEVLIRSDEMPSYGFHPTTAWRDGDRIVERRWLRLEGGDADPDLASRLDASETYIVEVALYDGLSEQELGSGRLLDVSIER